jgi:hypothetical protein
MTERRKQQRGAFTAKPGLTGRWLLVDDVLTLDKPVVFPVEKDRPILFSALATADVLLTLDRADFGRLLGTAFYGLEIMTPGMWLWHRQT